MDEEDGECVEQPLRCFCAERRGEECSIGQRILQVSGDQCCGKRFTGRVDTLACDRHRLYSWNISPMKLGQESILAFGKFEFHFLDCVDDALDANKAHDVTRDSPR